MNPLRHLKSTPVDEWPQLYQRALAAGSGLTIDPEIERVSAADELVALTLPEPVRLGALAVIADGSEWPRECARAARQDAAAVLRLLDRALLAHGRDAGYTVDAWREHASIDAFTMVGVVASMQADEQPHTTMIEAIAEAIASVVIALHRDRVGVP